MTSSEIFSEADIDAELADAEGTAPAPAVDPNAPYGYLKDGVTPKRGPGGRPAGKAGRRPGPRPGGSRPGGTTRPPGPGPTAPAPKRSSAPRPKSGGGKDYRPGLTGLLHLVAFPLNFASPLDAAAVILNAEELADAVNETAKERAEVAALCERLLQVGPYGLIIGVGMKIGAQVAENHGWLPTAVTTKLGAVPRAELAAHLAAQAGAQGPSPVQETSGE